MRQSMTVFLAWMACLGGNAASAQETKNLAELVPAKTLVFVEVRQPGALVKEVAGLLKGSYLEDVPDSMAPLTAKFPMHHRGMHLGMLAGGLWCAPEVVEELGRVKGAAVAITGISKEERQPEFVAIIQQGDSHVISFLMRLAMIGFASGGKASFDKNGVTTEWRGGFERIGEFEGISLYRFVDRKLEFKNGKLAGKPEVRAHGPVVARAPNAILVGSPDQVKDTILRMKGKSSGPSLAGVKAFQTAEKEFAAKPGVVAFANPQAVFELLEKGDLIELGREGADVLKIVRSVVNPRAFEAVADQLTLENATLSYRRRVYLNSKEKSPLLGVLPKKGVSTHLLHFAPTDALGFAALSNDDGEKRLKHALNLADEWEKALGHDDRLPSLMLAKVEESLGLDIGKDVAGNIQGVALAVAGLDEILKANELEPAGMHMLGRAAAVTILVDAVDARAASYLATTVLPKVVKTLAGQPSIEVAEEKVGGHLISSLPTKRGPTLFYGIKGTTLVVGMRPQAVAQALTNGEKKKGLLGDERIAQRVDNLKAPFALAMTRPMALAGLLVVRDFPAAAAPEAKSERREQMLLDLLKNEQPLLLGLTRSKDQLTGELTYPGLHPLVARLTNLLLEEGMRSYESQRPPRAIEKKGIDEQK